MLRAFAAVVRIALVAFALTAPLAGCGIKGPLRLPPGATPTPVPTPPELAPPKPAASGSVDSEETETKP
jgi:predicted small lipoprotein YifL